MRKVLRASLFALALLTGGQALAQNLLAIQPQAGLLAFTDLQGNFTTRGAAGMSLELNATPWLWSDTTEGYLGFFTGAIGTHLGSTSAGFFGTTTPNAAITDPTANLVIIPLNLKLGADLGRAARVSVHLGANLIYRSVGNSIDLGSSSVTSDSVWQIFPDIGADLQLAIWDRFSLLARPEITLTAGDTLFSGMLGFSVSI
jgi:hypothetical protein